MLKVWDTYIGTGRGALLISISSGILIGLGIIFPGIWLSTIVGIALMVWWCKKFSTRFGAVQVFFLGFLWWLSAKLITVFWFWSVYPFDWLGETSHGLQIMGIGLYWLICGTALASFGGTVSLFIRFFSVQEKELFIWLLPFVWLGAEVAGSFIFSLVTIAPSITPNLGFSFGYVGYVLAHHTGLLQLAQFGGVYALTFFTVLIVTTTVLLVNHFSINTSRIAIAFAVVLLLLSGKIVPVPVATLSITVGTINTLYDSKILESPNGRDLRVKEMREAVFDAGQFEFDYLLLPEDSRLSNSFSSPTEVLNWYRFTNRTSGMLIDSGFVNEGGKQYMRAYLYDLDSMTIESFDKQYLVPQGEFFPTLLAAGARFFGKKDFVEEVKSKLNYEPGPLKQLFEKNDTPLILFCSESLVPYASRRAYEKNNIPLVLHPLSHAWFHEPDSLWPQLDAMLRVQAVWSKSTIVSAGNMAPGKVYYSNGAQAEIPALLERERYMIGVVEL